MYTFAVGVVESLLEDYDYVYSPRTIVVLMPDTSFG